MNASEIVNLALKTIQTLGLVGSGLWAAYTFFRLQRPRTAELENQARRNDLLRQQPILAIEIKVTETGWDKDGKNGLMAVLVTLKNEGDQNLEALFDKAALTVGRIAFDKEGDQIIKKPRRYPHLHMFEEDNKPEPILLRIFRAGQKRQLAFGVPIAEPGGYFIEFHTTYEWRPFDAEIVNEKKRHPKPKPIPGIYAFEQTVFYAMGPTSANAFQNQA